MREARADSRARQNRGEERRGTILAEAAKLLAERGFRGTSIQNIADQVGMTHPGLLYYFGSKERLLHEVVAERERIELEAMRNWEREGVASLRRLPDLARLNVENDMYTRLHQVLVVENFDAASVLHDFFVQWFQRARQITMRVARADIARGDLADDVDLELLAVEVVAVLHGLETQWLLDPGRVDPIAAIDGYVESLFRRYGP